MMLFHQSAMSLSRLFFSACNCADGGLLCRRMFFIWIHVLKQKASNWIGHVVISLRQCLPVQRILFQLERATCICGCRKQLHVNSFMSFISIASGVAWATLLLLPLFPLRLFFYDSSSWMKQKSWISSLVVQLRRNEQNDFKMPSMRTECSNHIRNHFLFLPAQCLHCLFVFFVWISQVLICQRLPTVWLCVCRWTSV